MRLNKAFKTSLALGLLAAFFVTSSTAASSDQQTLAEQGKYVARAADCAACHTAPDGGKAYAGGYAIASPLGTIYSTNITPSKVHGIGGWTEAQFTKAVRQGVSADGRRLYPAMPYTEYGAMSDADVHALYVYFSTGVTPADEAPEHVTRLDFPYRIRPLMAVWDALYARKQPTAPDDASDTAARGRYLVDVLGHCGSCHTPRNIFMASDDSRYLAGGDVGGWQAPNITSDPVAGIGGWSSEELVDFMKTGHAAGKAQAAGGMAEAVENSLSHLNDDDLAAMAAYLKTVPPQSQPGQTKPSYGYGEAASAGYASMTPHRRRRCAARRQIRPPASGSWQAARTPTYLASPMARASTWMPAPAAINPTGREQSTTTTLRCSTTARRVRRAPTTS